MSTKKTLIYWDQYEAASQILDVLRHTDPDKVERVIDAVTVIVKWIDNPEAERLVLPPGTMSNRRLSS